MTDKNKTDQDNTVVHAYSEYKNTFNIVKAHVTSGLSMIVWGSSGFGKSKSIEAFAKELGKECFVLPMADKSAIDMFAMGIVDGKLEEFPAWWVRKLCSPLDEEGKPYPPMILFLDEITRAHSSMLPIIMEIANDHRVAGRPMRKDITILAASNFDSEDGGHQDLSLNQAGMRRFTHVTHKLDYSTALKHSTGSKKKVMEAMGPASMSYYKQGNFYENYDHKQLACERQSTDAFTIVEAGKDFLTDTEIRTIFCGRLGLEMGEAYAQGYFDLRNKQEAKIIPEVLMYDNFEQVAELEVSACRLEIVALLTSQFQEAVKKFKESSKDSKYLDEMDVVINYLHEKAEPETVNTVFDKIGYGDLTSNALAVNLRDGKIKRSEGRCIMYAFSNSRGNGKHASTTGRSNASASA